MYNGLVMENTDINSEIVTVSATDADTASNNVEIVYAFTGMYVGAAYSVIAISTCIGDTQYADRFAIDQLGVIRNLVQLVRWMINDAICSIYLHTTMKHLNIRYQMGIHYQNQNF